MTAYDNNDEAKKCTHCDQATNCFQHPMIKESIEGIKENQVLLTRLISEVKDTQAKLGNMLDKHLEAHTIIERLEKEHRSEMVRFEEDELRKLTAAVGSAVAIAVKETLVDTVAAIKPIEKFPWYQQIGYNILDRAITAGLFGLLLLIMTHSDILKIVVGGG